MLAVRVLSAFLATTFARVRRGPLRPTWGTAFEAIVSFLRANSQRGAALSPLGERELNARLRPQASRAMRTCRRTRATIGGVDAVWFEPPSASDRVILYAHGGAFIFGSIESHADITAKLAHAAGARVLSVDYRLAPEHPFPAGLDDCVAAYEGLLSQGFDPKRLVVAGDSAGGNLAVSLLLVLRSRNRPLPAGAIAICPWVDPARTGGSLDENEKFDWGSRGRFSVWCDTYAAGHDVRDPLLSPIHADVSNLPPMCVIWGSCEVLRDQIREFADRVRDAGVDIDAEEYPDMVHDWITLDAFTPQGAKAYERMGAFARTVVPGE